MKIQNSLSLLALVCTMVFTSCKKDEAPTAVILQEIAYSIFEVDNSGISGTATFTQEDNGSTHVLIELKNANTTTNPAFINYNSTTEGGAVAITLKACECSISNTTITNLDNGNSITYDGLLVFDGHITILDENDIIVAMGNIGSN